MHILPQDRSAYDQFWRTYVFSGEAKRVFWEIFGPWYLHVVASGRDSANVYDIFCELGIPYFLDVSFLVGGFPLGKLSADEHVEKWVLIECDLIH